MKKNTYNHQWSLIFTFMLLAGMLQAQKKAACCLPGGATEDAIIEMGGMKIPNAELLNQDGETVRFYDLIKGKTVAINFVFTTCKTICPPMGANFSKVKQLLESHVGHDLAMISISLDPTVDTPERMKEWQEKFNAGSGWTMLSGNKTTVDNLLKALKVFTPLKEEHSPILLVGKDGDDQWIRTNGLAEPEKIASIIRNYLPKTPATEPSAIPATNADLAYFSDTRLTDQNGVEHRLFSDLMQDKVVLINVFFSECQGTCPVMSTSLGKIQERLGERLGKEVMLLSISVDCTRDTPALLKAYAERFQARPGWHFLTGPKENVDFVLKKLGQYAETRESHNTIMLIGNTKTRLWKKANGLAAADEIYGILETVINDQK